MARGTWNCSPTRRPGDVEPAGDALGGDAAKLRELPDRHAGPAVAEEQPPGEAVRLPLLSPDEQRRPARQPDLIPGVHHGMPERVGDQPAPPGPCLPGRHDDHPERHDLPGNELAMARQSIRRWLE